jgi:hypothetical protein
MIKSTSLYYYSLICFVLSFTSYTIDNPHFYRANFFWGEPRFEKKWLTSVDFLLGGGGTKKARNKNGHKTPLLNIFGLHNMRVLGQNVPALDPNNALDKILLDLEQVPARDDFGKLLFKGDFSIIEAVLNGYQNLVNGFFFQAYLPIRRLAINNIQFIDESPDDLIFPNKNTPEWVSFLGNFPSLLARYNREIKNVNEAGNGDFTLLVGWTSNYQDNCYIDFFDVTAKIGLLFPVAKKRNLRNPFDLPLGYDGFYGLPLKFDCSIGYWEWLTVGFHIGSLFLFDREKTVAMKTALDQNGFISLTQGKASVDPGTIWDICNYVKADHIFRGLSLLVGYCYTQKDNDCITPCDTQIFNSSIVKSDQLFKNWRMHVVHWFLEYDFAKKPSDIGPRIGFFYNWVVGGERIFNTTIAASTVGIDVSWCF